MPPRLLILDVYNLWLCLRDFKKWLIFYSCSNRGIILPVSLMGRDHIVCVVVVVVLCLRTMTTHLDNGTSSSLSASFSPISCLSVYHASSRLVHLERMVPEKER